MPPQNESQTTSSDPHSPSPSHKQSPSSAMDNSPSSMAVRGSSGDERKEEVKQTTQAGSVTPPSTFADELSKFGDGPVDPGSPEWAWWRESWRERKQEAEAEEKSKATKTAKREDAVSESESASENEGTRIGKKKQAQIRAHIASLVSERLGNGRYGISLEELESVSDDWESKGTGGKARLPRGEEHAAEEE